MGRRERLRRLLAGSLCARPFGWLVRLDRPFNPLLHGELPATGSAPGGREARRVTQLAARAEQVRLTAFSNRRSNPSGSFSMAIASAASFLRASIGSPSPAWI